MLHNLNRPMCLTVLAVAFSWQPCESFAATSFRQGDTVVVLSAGTPMKSGDAVLSVLDAGESFTVLDAQDGWLKGTIRRNAKPITGWVWSKHVCRPEDLRPHPEGKAITNAREFQRSLAHLLHRSRQAMKEAGREYAEAPYVAFSLKVAQRHIQESPSDFRQADPDVWLLGGINRVRGFVYDQENDDLILVGSAEPNRGPLTLDDVVVALRARLRYDAWPLVSIDPLPDTEDSMIQHVRYDGGIRDTLFGLDMLIADINLKGWAMGYCDAGLSGFPSMWARWLATDPSNSSATSPEQICSRYWFYPVDPHVVVREDVCAIDKLEVQVYTEVLSVTVSGKASRKPKDFHDKASEAFASQVSTRFKELAKQNYALNRLQGLQELVGLVSGLEQLDRKPYLSWWLCDYPVLNIPTPSQLPLACRRSDNSGRSRSLSGGVHLTALALRVTSGNAAALRRAVLETRPSSRDLHWAFSVGKWIIPLAPGQIRPELLAPLYSQSVFLYHQQRYEEALTLCDRIIQTAPDRVEAWNVRGLALHEMGRSEEALECYDKATELNPHCVEVCGNKGALLNNLGRPEEALDVLQLALSLAPGRVELWVNKGCSFHQLGRRNNSAYLELALDCYDEALKLDPNCGDAWRNKGAVLVDLGQFQAAVKCYNRAIELAPHIPDTWRAKALALVKLKDSDTAMECLEQAIQLNPNYRGAWFVRGLLLEAIDRRGEAAQCYARLDKPTADTFIRCGMIMEDLEQYGKAINYYDAAISLTPDCAEAWYRKAVALTLCFQVGPALQCCERAIALKPDYADPWSQKGTILFMTNRFDEAKAAFKHSHQPDRVAAYEKDGTSFMEKGWFWEALKCFERLVELRPDDGGAWYNKGIVLIELDQLPEAIESLDRAIALEPDSALAWYNKGVLLAESDRLEEALDCYSKSISLNSDDAVAWIGRGHVLNELGRSERALADFDVATEHSPESLDAWLWKGVMLFDLKRYADALACFERATEIDPESAMAWCDKGLALRTLDRHEEALVAYERALELRSDDWETWYGKAMCCIRLKQDENALEALDQVILREPDCASAWAYKGEQLAKLGRPDEALKHCEHAVKLAPEDADVRFLKGAALVHLQRFQQAILVLEKASDLGHSEAASMLDTVRAQIAKGNSSNGETSPKRHSKPDVVKHAGQVVP